MTTRAQIVQLARALIGTPYAHAQRVPGVGIDCAGVLVCVARQGGCVDETFDVPTYAPDPDGVTMLAWCDRYMGLRIAQEDMQPGDAIVLKSVLYPQHLGILADYVHGGLSVIHASNSRTLDPPRVIEARLFFNRRQRFVASFAFPGV